MVGSPGFAGGNRTGRATGGGRGDPVEPLAEGERDPVVVRAQVEADEQRDRVDEVAARDPAAEFEQFLQVGLELLQVGLAVGTARAEDVLHRVHI